MKLVSSSDKLSSVKIDEYSGFNSKFKKVLKKYRNSFSDDFERVLKVIKGKLAIGTHPKQMPQTNQISGLGESIKYPFFKTRIYIAQAKSTTGRLVYLYDENSDCIFLADVYFKKNQDNHDDDLISKAYKEYTDSLEVVCPKCSNGVLYEVLHNTGLLNYMCTECDSEFDHSEYNNLRNI